MPDTTTTAGLLAWARLQPPGTVRRLDGYVLIRSHEGVCFMATGRWDRLIAFVRDLMTTEAPDGGPDPSPR